MVQKFKIAIVHNYYEKFGGEDAFVKEFGTYFDCESIEFIYFTKKSAVISQKFYGKLYAFFSGFFNPISAWQFFLFLRRVRPDVVHVHNLFPYISPSILVVSKCLSIPVVMTLHNYRLECPNGLFYQKGRICEKCTSDFREIHCVLNNCEGQLIKSVAYAGRGFFSRILGLFSKNVDLFVALTEFQKRKHLQSYPKSKVQVIGNTRGETATLRRNNVVEPYVAYVGRISAEKGVGLLLKVARRNPKIVFRIAGIGELSLFGDVPPNVICLGLLDRDAVQELIANAQFGVLASVCYEGFPLVVLEFMQHGKACIVPCLGGMPEIVKNEDDLVFVPNNWESLENKIISLWDSTEKSIKFGESLQQLYDEKYSSKIIAEKYKKIYEDLLKFKVRSCGE